MKRSEIINFAVGNIRRMDFKLLDGTSLSSDDLSRLGRLFLYNYEAAGMNPPRHSQDYDPTTLLWSSKEGWEPEDEE